MPNINKKEYHLWLQTVKSEIRSAQVKAAVVVNKELILFYWKLGRMITEKQKNSNWGDKVIERLSKDLQQEFPSIQGLSKTNLKYTKRFYIFYESLIGQQPVDQLGGNPVFGVPWGHNIFIFTKSKTQEEAYFYLQQTLQNHWSRDVLALQIKSNLYQKQGKAITNFETTLPKPQSDLAQQTIKDPYLFDVRHGAIYLYT